ncbi:MAG: hypothetical protein AAF629_01965 [Chloroflexota bacterium]
MSPSPFPRLQRRFFPMALIISIILFVLLQMLSARILPLTQEEGISIQIAMLLERGHQPYNEIFTFLQPLFLWLLEGIYQPHISPYQHRDLIIIFGLMSLVSTILIARLVAGSLAAAAAGFLFITTTTILTEATNLIAMGPALSLGLLSVLTLLYFCKQQRSAWLACSAALWTTALFLSTAVFAMGLTHLVFLALLAGNAEGQLQRRVNLTNLTRPYLIWIMVTFIIAGIFLFLSSPIYFSYLIPQQQTLWASLPINQVENFSIIGNFIALNVVLAGFTLVGLVYLQGHGNHPLWAIILWGLLNFGWLMIQNTLQASDVIILVPPMCVIAGWGAIQIGGQANGWLNRLRNPARWKIGSTLLFVIVYLVIVWQQVARYQIQSVRNADDIVQINERPQVINFIGQHTQTDHCVITDDTTLAIEAGRAAHPNLVDLSEARVTSGLLTESDIMTHIENTPCTLVLFSKRTYYLHLRDVRSWASQHFEQEQRFTKTRIYYGE